ncbi:ABC transporter substrate-binding protein [Bacillus niameyensis]|uniref:ABC transporter substrate-binding protein n=1 Tax=Bacillus niameyensis TaxID=1522308 RepID=UPI00078253F7|nr:extracellular solute-binding protein [Bacillus niameyensis]
MISRKKRSLVFIILIGLLLIFTACSKGTEDVGGNADQNDNDKGNDTATNTDVGDGEREKVTIKIAFPLSEEWFDARFGTTDEKLEHIDLEYVPYGGTSEALQEMFAEDIQPDIIVGDYPPIKELKLGYPLDDLAEKHGFDLNRFDPSLLSFMRSLDDEGKVAGFPDGGSFFGLYYNKDVFDALGKEYPDPKVPMTWDEMLDLAREMTVKQGETQYIGLGGGIGVALAQFAPRKTDPDTGEVLLEKNQAFKRYLDLYEQWMNIPGMKDPELPSFAEDQTVAMFIASNNFFSWGFGNPDPEEIEQFDLAPIPVWSDLPTATPAKNAWPMVIANYSEHKDEAFEVLMTYMDPEIQIGMAKSMMLQTPLIDSEILENYASEVPSYEGKNIEAYFFGESAEYEGRQSNWDQYVDIGEAERKIREENMDVVTVLRELAEESDGKIKEAMGAQ